MPKFSFSTRFSSARKRKYGKRKGARRSVGKRSRRSNRYATVRDVRRIIHAGRENKFASSLLESAGQFNGRISTVADIYSIVPKVVTGTEQWEKIGDSIMPKSLTVKFVVTFVREFMTGNKPILCRLMCLKYKPVKNFAGLQNVPVNQLLKMNDYDLGIAATQYDGSIGRHILPVNTDSFDVIKDIRFRMDPVDYANAEVSPTPNIVRMFTIRIPCPKVLKYDRYSQGNDYPTNFAPFWCFGWTWADGVVPGINAVNVNISARSFITYEDA